MARQTSGPCENGPGAKASGGSIWPSTSRSDETIPIDEVIDTTIRIDTPLGNIPVDVQVPVKLDVPIQLDVSIPVNETIPVTAEVPVKLAIPITVDVADTELASLTKALADGLIELRNVLSGLAG